MVEDLIGLIDVFKEFGFGAIAFLMVYILLDKQQKKAFAQSESTLDFARQIVSANTKALTKMNDSMIAHIRQKEEFIERMKECARNKDERLTALEKTLIDWSMR